MKPSFVSPIIKKLAKRAGVKVILEPTYKYAGRIELPDGRMRYFKGTSFDLNPLGASDIAKDKAYASFFLEQLGYRTVKGDSFFTVEWAKKIKRPERGPEAAYEYARTIGLPVIVKPNSLSQGAGVCKVYNKREFMRAVRSYSNRDRVFLVQEAVQGRDYRIVVLNDEVISAYERTPLCVIGDGRSTVEQLLRHKQRHFEETERDTVIKIDDFRIEACLRRQGLSIKSVIERRRRVVLLDNANLSSGGDAIDVIGSMDSRFSKLAVDVTKAMGLRFCGVDLMIKGSISEPCADYHVLEINAAPGLDHYADIGKKQKKVVDELYLKVLRAMKDLA